MRNKGAVFTREVQVAADYIRNNKVVCTLFGNENIFGLFSKVDPQALKKVSDCKQRDLRPFFRVGSADAKTLQHIVSQDSGIHPETSDSILMLASTILAIGSQYGPIGILLEGSDAVLPRIKGSIKTAEGKTITTVGFMVSPQQGDDFTRLISHIADEHLLLAGTSANPSGAPESGGSGHHSFGGVVYDFGLHQDICFYIPDGPKNGKGFSTTIIFLDRNGLVEVIRQGSIDKETTINILTEAGVDLERILFSRATNISKYDYDKHESGPYERNLIHALVDEATRTREWHMPLSLVKRQPPEVVPVSEFIPRTV
jgi:tRNA A37 threonylcarbamoyladenosine synthetase subunit TsaC/SUA5/YrdC